MQAGIFLNKRKESGSRETMGVNEGCWNCHYLSLRWLSNTSILVGETPISMRNTKLLSYNQRTVMAKASSVGRPEVHAKIWLTINFISAVSLSVFFFSFFFSFLKSRLYAAGVTPWFTAHQTRSSVRQMTLLLHCDFSQTCRAFAPSCRCNTKNHCLISIQHSRSESEDYCCSLQYRSCSGLREEGRPRKDTPDHLLLDSTPNLAPHISRWEINKFENCWSKGVRILEVLKLLFQQCLNLSSSQRDMSGPILGDLSNNRWSGGYSVAPCSIRYHTEPYQRMPCLWCRMTSYCSDLTTCCFSRKVNRSQSRRVSTLSRMMMAKSPRLVAID